MRRVAWLALAVCVTGCSGGDGNPEVDRLTPMSMAVAYEPGKDGVLVEKPSGEGVDVVTTEFGTFVPPGTRVLVLEDNDELHAGFRDVRVTIKEGKLEGVVGIIMRKNLRPAK